MAIIKPFKYESLKEKLAMMTRRDLLVALANNRNKIELHNNGDIMISPDVMETINNENAILVKMLHQVN